MAIALPAEAQALADTVRRFVDREVMPVANELEHADEFPQALLDQMNAMGLLGCTIGERFGGSGLPFVAYAAVVEGKADTGRRRYASCRRRASSSGGDLSNTGAG